MLYAKFSPELDAVETHEVGFSNAFPKKIKWMRGKEG